ncbi:hypothetical protein TanjilG_20226 [Lupinus angustifolius]|uniref:Phospho-N-acetylmuramoyl-pentapeptide-transferase n=1 Tax=Lupinus angustifolius TaxID=3871 RepID=A0A1J7H0A1_LUPAN|nr:hypothetical protein TanjilG_20226 [Lupinus angustifolius]
MASSHSRFLNHLPPRSSTNRLNLLPSSSSFHFHSSPFNLHLSIIQRESCRCCVRRNVLLTRAFDEDSFDMPMLDDWNADESSLEHAFSSSDGEDSDDEVLLTPMNDVDLPSVSVSNNEAITLAAHRFANLGRDRKKHRQAYWCAWRIVRLPLSPFYLTRPFLISAVLVSFAGYVCVPIFRRFKVVHVIKQQGPFRRRSSKRTPTLGGLFFIPVGITVAQVIAGSSSIEVSGAAGVTIAFAAVGLLNDILSLTKNHRRGLPAVAEVLLEGAVGTWFSFWLDINSISSPYGMKMLVPLPLGLVYLGRYYKLLTSFCFVSVGHGMKFADALDGLAGGTAALAFTGMSIAVLPICSELGIFGASMAGSCVGFLLHNRYKASVFMGNTGSLALGGALAAMASSTGMFFPLFISSGIFIVEASSVVIQMVYLKINKGFQGGGWRLFRMRPFHHHLQLHGFREPNIVLGAYLISSLLALLGGYIGLVSA